MATPRVALAWFKSRIWLWTAEDGLLGSNSDRALAEVGLSTGRAEATHERCQGRKRDGRVGGEVSGEESPEMGR